MKNLFKSILSFQKEMKGIEKDTSGRFGKYLSLDNLINEVKPVLLNHGLFFVQHVSSEGVNTTLFHESGEQLESGNLLIDANELVNKAISLAQAQGIAITYAKRYQLGAILGISTDPDTDADNPDKPTTDADNPDKPTTAPKKEKFTPDKPWFNDKELAILKKGYAPEKVRGMKSWIRGFTVSKEMKEKIASVDPYLKNW